MNPRQIAKGALEFERVAKILVGCAKLEPNTEIRTMTQPDADGVERVVTSRHYATAVGRIIHGGRHYKHPIEYINNPSETEE